MKITGEYDNIEYEIWPYLFMNNVKVLGNWQFQINKWPRFCRMVYKLQKKLIDMKYERFQYVQQQHQIDISFSHCFIKYLTIVYATLLNHFSLLPFDKDIHHTNNIYNIMSQ